MGVRDMIARFDQGPPTKKSTSVEGFAQVEGPIGTERFNRKIRDDNNANNKSTIENLKNKSIVTDTKKPSRPSSSYSPDDTIRVPVENEEAPSSSHSQQNAVDNKIERTSHIEVPREIKPKSEIDHKNFDHKSFDHKKEADCQGKFAFLDIISPNPNISAYVTNSKATDKFSRKLLNKSTSKAPTDDMLTNRVLDKSISKGATEDILTVESKSPTSSSSHDRSDMPKESLMLPLILERSHSQDVGVADVEIKDNNIREAKVPPRIESSTPNHHEVGNLQELQLSQAPELIKHRTESQQLSTLGNLYPKKQKRRYSNPFPASSKGDSLVENSETRIQNFDVKGDEKALRNQNIHDTLLKVKGSVDALLESFTTGNVQFNQENELLLHDVEKVLDFLHKKMFFVKGKAPTPSSYSPANPQRIPLRNPQRLPSSIYLYLSTPPTPETPSTFKAKAISLNKIENSHVIRSSSKKSTPSLRSVDSLHSNGAKLIVSNIEQLKLDHTKDQDTELSTGVSASHNLENLDKQTRYFTPRTIMRVEDTLDLEDDYGDTVRKCEYISSNPLTPKSNLPITVGVEAENGSGSIRTPSFFKRLIQRKRFSGGHERVYISLPEMRSASPFEDSFGTPRTAPQSPIAPLIEGSDLILEPFMDRKRAISECTQDVLPNTNIEQPTNLGATSKKITNAIHSQRLIQPHTNDNLEKQVSIISKETLRRDSQSTTSSLPVSLSKHHYWKLIKGVLPGHRHRKPHFGVASKSFSQLSPPLLPDIPLNQNKSSSSSCDTIFGDVVEFMDYIDAKFLLNDSQN
ncbi:uncharacterized protein KQ657_000230 [Scheffersomyces spartinae]|uniref:Uncharacterized protein n=1 Tax=Scheffersomyces spartinae TaxID=45513 RepID=A0A9P8AKR2_9ASCO|nr:uncharacterized protein KQ657_000230 [Scheffersomyces spartinae]KAG7196217.1 hypothetical protein KQ657_000230 [Scheffersomyces spartinae]